MAPAPAGPQRARSNPTGTRSGWPIPPECSRARELLDAPPHHVSADETIEIAKDYEFLVLFTTTVGWAGDHALAEAIKQANPSIKIAFVGPPVTTDPDRALNECAVIDFVCRREFDFSVVEFANGKPLNEILGISYKDADGIIQHNPDRPQVEDLDAMPWATKIYKRDMDVTRYNVPFLLHPYIALYSTRGCPAQCTFCLWPQTLSGHAWRKRSTDDVAAEMKWAKENFPHVKEFFFDDDTFNIQKARTIELCEKLKPLGITWSCTSRVTTDRETLKAMKDAGCRLLIVGFESGDPQILKNIKKGATVERARDFAKDCHDLGLIIHADFILGLPGETKESIRNTINFAKTLDCETIQVSDRARLSGHGVLRLRQEERLHHQSKRWRTAAATRWRTSSTLACPPSTSWRWCTSFYDEYYFRPKAAFRVVWKAIVNRDVPRLYVEAKAFMKLRAQRNKIVKDTKQQQAAKAAPVVNAGA